MQPIVYARHEFPPEIIGQVRQSLNCMEAAVVSTTVTDMDPERFHAVGRFI